MTGNAHGNFTETVMATNVGWYGSHDFCLSPDGRQVAWVARAVEAEAPVDDDRLLVNGRPWARHEVVSDLRFTEDGAHLVYTARLTAERWRACVDRAPAEAEGRGVFIYSACRDRMVSSVDESTGSHLIAERLQPSPGDPRPRRLWRFGPYLRLVHLEAPDGGHVRAVVLRSEGATELLEVVDGEPGTTWPRPEGDIAAVLGPGDFVTREKSWRGVRLRRHGKLGPPHVAIIGCATSGGHFAYAARDGQGCRGFVDGEPGPSHTWVDPPVFPPEGGPPAFLVNEGAKLIDDRNPAAPWVDGGRWMILHGGRCLPINDVDMVGSPQIAPHTNALVAIGYRGAKKRLVGDVTTAEVDHIARVRIAPSGRTVQVAASRGETLLCQTAAIDLP